MNSYDSIVARLQVPDSIEKGLFDEFVIEHHLHPSEDFEHIIGLIEDRIEQLAQECNFDDDAMDGDHESALTSMGWGLDESYGDDVI